MTEKDTAYLDSFHPPQRSRGAETLRDDVTLVCDQMRTRIESLESTVLALHAALERACRRITALEDRLPYGDMK